MAKNFKHHGCRWFSLCRGTWNAICATGNRIVAATDPHDAVGVLDRYAFDVRFFTEFERFDRHLRKSRRGPESERVHYAVSICSPNSRTMRTFWRCASGPTRSGGEAARHQSVESRRNAGARARDRPPRHHDFSNCASIPRCPGGAFANGRLPIPASATR